MTTKTDGGPAFPFGQISETTGQPVNGFYDPGMTLRDYFAAKAMAAMVASPDYVEGAWFQEDIALQAYTMADAMLKARDEE